VSGEPRTVGGGPSATKGNDSAALGRHRLLPTVYALLALALLAGCAGEPARPAPDPAVVNVLAEVLLAESRAAADGADADSARTAALAAHDAAPADLDRWLADAADDPDEGEALWEAVAQLLDAERLSGGR